MLVWALRSTHPYPCPRPYPRPYHPRPRPTLTHAPVGPTRHRLKSHLVWSGFGCGASVGVIRCGRLRPILASGGVNYQQVAAVLFSVLFPRETDAVQHSPPRSHWRHPCTLQISTPRSHWRHPRPQPISTPGVVRGCPGRVMRIPEYTAALWSSQLGSISIDLTLSPAGITLRPPRLFASTPPAGQDG